MRLQVLSGIALLACGLTVFGRSLSARQGFLTGINLPSLSTSGDTTTALDGSPAEVPTNEIGGDTQSTNSLLSVPSFNLNTSPVLSASMFTAPTNQIEPGDSQTTNSLPSINPAPEIAAVVPQIIQETIRYLQSNRYCLFQLSLNNDHLLYWGCGKSASWAEFTAAFKDTRSGFALLRLKDDTVLSIMNLYRQCQQQDSDENWYHDDDHCAAGSEEKILFQFKEEWVSLVRSAYHKVESIDSIYSDDQLGILYLKLQSRFASYGLPDDTVATTFGSASEGFKDWEWMDGCFSDSGGYHVMIYELDGRKTGRYLVFWMRGTSLMTERGKKTVKDCERRVAVVEEGREKPNLGYSDMGEKVEIRKKSRRLVLLGWHVDSRVANSPAWLYDSPKAKLGGLSKFETEGKPSRWYQRDRLTSHLLVTAILLGNLQSPNLVSLTRGSWSSVGAWVYETSGRKERLSQANLLPVFLLFSIEKGQSFSKLKLRTCNGWFYTQNRGSGNSIDRTAFEAMRVWIWDPSRQSGM